MVTHPDRHLSSVDIMDEEEKEKVLVAFNDTAANFPADRCPYQLFEEQVEKTPDQTAVCFEETALSYRELNTRANQLAHYLRKNGVAKESKVGLLVDRSLAMLIGILGIQKAGGAYLPITRNIPGPGWNTCSKIRRAPVLVTQSAFLDSLSRLPDNTVALDRDADKIASRAGKPGTPGFCREPVPSHLHVGLNRPSQGRDDRAPERHRVFVLGPQ